MTSAYERIYAIVKMIPRGKVAYYGQIACLAGIPRGARAVGNAMASCPEGAGIPCHRVVDKSGGTKAAFDTFQRDTQRAMLEAEGVLFTADGRVDMASCCWDGMIEQ